MNPKFVLVGVGSALLAAGLTYWAVSPVRSAAPVASVGKVAKMATVAPPPLIISSAEPEAVVVALPPAPVPVSKTKPLPVKTTEPTVAKLVEEPTKPEVAPVAAAIPESEPVRVPATPPPPTRVALSPPKEIDRPAEPAVIRDNVARAPNTVTINQGTALTVRLGETLSVQKNLTGDTFFATLDVPLVADGFVLAEKGARVEGKIIEVDKAGKLSGTSRLSLELTQVNTSDGQRVHLQTSTFTKDGAERSRKNDAAKVGGGAILGAIIGAAAGGGKGAGVGAGVGGAAGAGAVLLSGGRNVTIPVETKLIFRLEKPVTITERVMQ